MTRQEEITTEIKKLKIQLEPLEAELRTIHQKSEEETEEKIKRCYRLEDKFEPAELNFAAYTRCPCGHGMAYPKSTGSRGSWNCSAILLGIADVKATHEAELPFAFYSIKSEGQPSAGGATTRPK